MIPETWSKVMNRLGKAGWDARRREDARTGYELGYYAALHQLGATASADSMAKVWHEYYGEAKADAKDALKRIKAGERGGVA